MKLLRLSVFFRLVALKVCFLYAHSARPSSEREIPDWGIWRKRRRIWGVQEMCVTLTV